MSSVEGAGGEGVATGMRQHYQRQTPKPSVRGNVTTCSMSAAAGSHLLTLEDGMSSRLAMSTVTCPAGLVTEHGLGASA